MVTTVFIIWQGGDNDQKIADIKEALSSYISDHCNCQVFSPQYIIDASLACSQDNDNEFIFVGKILSTGEVNSTFLRRNVLQEYVQRSETVMVDGQPLKIDNYCSSTVLAEGNYRCLAEGDTTVATISNKNAVRTGIEIAIGVGAGTLVCLLVSIGCLILCMCCMRREVRSKYKEPRNDDLDIQ